MQEAPMKILIVDDAADTRMWMRVILQKKGWEVIEAHNGHAACKALDDTEIKVVITDWMMPGMDGLSLIEWIRNRDTDHYTYTILMTSRDHENDCVKGFSVGADDYITKPATSQILDARLGVAKRILSIHEELLTQQTQLKESRDMVSRAYDEVQADLENAAAVQKASLPGNGLLSESVSTAWCYRPAMGISGDYLDLIQVGEDRLFFYLLDVSGHGVTAALRSAAISQLLRPMSGLLDGLVDFGPGHVMEQLNHHLCQGNQDVDYFATLVMGDLDARTGILRLTSAGHPHPLLLRPGQSALDIEAGGLPVGIDTGATYRHAEVRLQPTDALLLFSDGLLDSEDRQGRHYGIDALRKQAESHSGCELDTLLSQLESDVDDWRDGTPITDDLSLLLLRYKPDSLPGVQSTMESSRCQNA